ncbi:hypothetical protein ACH4OW_33605 [Streptomyces sp. NPDC017056]|uniref:hypothetical protein n=1 Tax=Streptomyces sp. NPDC017056 TaxID=3364973 RepID=UPI00378739DC
MTRQRSRLLIGLVLPWPLISALSTVQKETPGELLGRRAAGHHEHAGIHTDRARPPREHSPGGHLLVAGVLGLTTAVLLAVTGRPRAVPSAGPSAAHQPREVDAAKKG